VKKHKHLSKIVMRCTDCTLHIYFTKCVSSCLTVNDPSGSSVCPDSQNPFEIFVCGL